MFCIFKHLTPFLIADLAYLKITYFLTGLNEDTVIKDTNNIIKVAINLNLRLQRWVVQDMWSYLWTADCTAILRDLEFSNMKKKQFIF